MCANIYVFIYFMISYDKDIAILYHYLTFSVNTRVRSPSVAGANSLHFLSVTRKKTEAKERVRKRPELGGRLSDFSSHSMRSSSARLACPRTRSAQTAFRISFLGSLLEPRLNMAPKIGHPLKTSSCGVFSSLALRSR